MEELNPGKHKPIKYKKLKYDPLAQEEETDTFQMDTTEITSPEENGIIPSNSISSLETLRENEDQNETSSLLSNFNIQELIKRYFDDKGSFKNFKGKSLVRAFSYLILGTSGLPLVEPAFKAAGDYQGLNYIFAGATFLTVGNSRIWAGEEILQEISVAIIDRNSCNHKPSQGSSVSRHIGCHILGLLSSIPFTYGVYKYNTTKELAFITFFSEYALGTYAYYSVLKQSTFENFKGILFRFFKKKDRNYINNLHLKNKNLSYIESLLEKLLSMEKEERHTHMGSISLPVTFNKRLKSKEK
ncbi:MAG: hypothetical protein JSS34_07315 [Proteobacteria bacterium]|nr:hypothetical protein [Pseudomonadota bacterium]